MLQKSFFEFLRYDWQQRFSICWGDDFSQPKQFGSLRKEMTYRFELLFSEILTQQRRVQKEAELPKVRVWDHPKEMFFFPDILHQDLQLNCRWGQESQRIINLSDGG
ncbi:hypothetical protein TNCV_2227101 [Trichonephila clavipes]|uniref:Uncharacterized protein n=1 Tax=Trichonephila clavipes TaxID=2585209 RepID=A0A8X6WFW1_TRICX|nr:hypothetical protein TNCV_2227101 [Trichonephila clavipes]